MTATECPEELALWPLAVDEEAAQEVAAHASACPQCQQAVQRLREEVEALRAAEETWSAAAALAAEGAQAADDSPRSSAVKSESSTDRPGRSAGPPRLRTVFFAACMLLCGVLYAFWTKEGCVRVVGPDGKKPPAKLALELVSDRARIELNAAKQWVSNVPPGAYRVRLTQGSENYQCRPQTLRVPRFGVTTVEVIARSEP